MVVSVVIVSKETGRRMEYKCVIDDPRNKSKETVCVSNLPPAPCRLDRRKAFIRMQHREMKVEAPGEDHEWELRLRVIGKTGG